MRGKIVHLLSVLVIPILVVLGSCALLAGGRQPAFLRVQSMGRVKGTVMDANGAVISTPRPSIIFEGKNGVRSVAANDSGDYEIALSPGIYKVTTEIPGFYPFRRAEFRVVPGSALMINVVPTPRYLVRGTTVSVTETVDTKAPLPKYDEFRIPEGPVSLLIQFQKKRIANRNVEYGGVTLTYDVLTIYADKLCFDSKLLLLEASGKWVIVEDGKQRLQVKQAAVAFKGGEPILDLMR